MLSPSTARHHPNEPHRRLPLDSSSPFVHPHHRRPPLDEFWAATAVNHPSSVSAIRWPQFIDSLGASPPPSLYRDVGAAVDHRRPPRSSPHRRTPPCQPSSIPHRRPSVTVSLHCCDVARRVPLAVVVLTPQSTLPSSHRRTASGRATARANPTR
jgi:hypothetical protein